MKLCIVGTGRCGTTLLWSMMNGHPDLFVYRETHWIPALHEAFGTGTGSAEAMLDIVTRTRFVNEMPVTELDSDAFRQSRGYRPEMTVRGFCDSLGMFFAEAEGKRLWADKTPDYGYFAANLQIHWPDCRIVHLIRDGVRTAESMSRHIGYQALAALKRRHWPPLALDFTLPADGFQASPMYRYADLWHDRLARTRDEARRLAPESYLELRYEDLVADPEHELRRIARLTELSENADWLAKATAMADAKRGAGRSSVHGVPGYFTERHRELLQALGYPAERC
jgi:Sulfotransferase family